VAVLIQLFGRVRAEQFVAEIPPPEERVAATASRPVEFGPSRPPVFTV
jgi:hypothetical protein